MKKITTFESIKKSLGNVIATIIKKQFTIAGVIVENYRFKEGWQSSEYWSKRQQGKFRKWFINYLYGNLKRTKGISAFPHITYRSKKRLNELWQYWNLDYGFRLDD